MNINKVLTKDYEKRTLGERGKNKPNSNPIKANTKPIKANKMPKQTQNKPNKTQPVVGLSNLFQSQKMTRHDFKQFEKKLVTARLSGDYLENREKDKRNNSFSFRLDMVRYGPTSN